MFVVDAVVAVVVFVVAVVGVSFILSAKEIVNAICVFMS